jgi:hypothetical protein
MEIWNICITTSWYILSPFGNFVVIGYIFSLFW